MPSDLNKYGKTQATVELWDYDKTTVSLSGQRLTIKTDRGSQSITLSDDEYEKLKTIIPELTDR